MTLCLDGNQGFIFPFCSLWVFTPYTATNSLGTSPPAPLMASINSPVDIRNIIHTLSLVDVLLSIERAFVSLGVWGAEARLCPE